MKLQEFKDKAFNTMVREILERFPDFNEDRVRFQLIEMILNHGVDAVNDLYGFYLWAYEKKRNPDYIWANIMHDFGGADDKKMAPRSANYMKYYFHEKTTGNETI